MLFFYQPDLSQNTAYLEDEEYQHCIKVLRKKPGDEVGLLDGKGLMCAGIITEVTGKRCQIILREKTSLPEKTFYNHIAIAPTKNIDRMEWFVEKACELGVNEISFLHTQNSERVKLRTDRLEKKAVSALKQSKSGWITKINSLVKFQDFLETDLSGYQKFMAVVESDLPYLSNVLRKGQKTVCLIGPEGDFTQEETSMSTNKGFSKISLGKSTLRTETAGLMAAHFVNVANEY